jgi:hypothetical protein
MKETVILIVTREVGGQRLTVEQAMDSLALQRCISPAEHLEHAYERLVKELDAAQNLKQKPK